MKNFKVEIQKKGLVQKNSKYNLIVDNGYISHIINYETVLILFQNLGVYLITKLNI